jgi:hypothetical protein
MLSDLAAWDALESCSCATCCLASSKAAAKQSRRFKLPLLLQAPMTTADLATWRANTAPAVGSALARMHALLLGSLTDLEAQLMQQVASAHAAAAAAEQVRSHRAQGGGVCVCVCADR